MQSLSLVTRQDFVESLLWGYNAKVRLYLWTPVRHIGKCRYIKTVRPLKLDAKWRRVVTFTIWPLFLQVRRTPPSSAQQMEAWWTPGPVWRLGRHQVRSGRFVEEKNRLTLRGIEPWFLDHAANTSSSSCSHVNYLPTLTLKVIVKQSVGRLYEYNEERKLLLH